MIFNVGKKEKDKYGWEKNNLKAFQRIKNALTRR
jgi:hypothetical protein